MQASKRRYMNKGNPRKTTSANMWTAVSTGVPRCERLHLNRSARKRQQEAKNRMTAGPAKDQGVKEARLKEPVSNTRGKGKECKGRKESKGQEW